jgi:hypothetical protein
MGDMFQTICDTEASEDEAASLAARTVDWLVSAGIVQAERTNCVLGNDLAHPPGPRCFDAVAEPDLADPWTDGLEIVTGRTVFHSGQDPIDNASCPHCETRFRFYDEDWNYDESLWEPFGHAIRTWHESGLGTFSCPRCATPSGLNDWRWEPQWAFGYLGFTFWNWPDLSPEFMAEFTRRLGHRTAYTWGKF